VARKSALRSTGVWDNLCREHDNFISLQIQIQLIDNYDQHWYPDPTNVLTKWASATENSRGMYTAHLADCTFCCSDAVVRVFIVHGLHRFQLAP
jgi:hypothetical protein